MQAAERLSADRAGVVNAGALSIGVVLDGDHHLDALTAARAVVAVVEADSHRWTLSLQTANYHADPQGRACQAQTPYPLRVKSALTRPLTELSSKSDRLQGIWLVVSMAAVMWVVEVIDRVDHGQLERYGIRPRSEGGLVGLVTAPFLHVSFAHLIGNTIPFLVLGSLIALSGVIRVLAVTAIVALVGGLGTWLIAPANTDHIGASGVVFGYAAYLVARGAFSKSATHIFGGLIVLAVYGTTLLFGLFPNGHVSWQGHLCGGLAGILAASVLEKRRSRVAIA
jgi:membrane associated rhomboid family serine protease